MNGNSYAVSWKTMRRVAMLRKESEPMKVTVTFEVDDHARVALGRHYGILKAPWSVIHDWARVCLRAALDDIENDYYRWLEARTEASDDQA
jgi:hypothetical protein